jgi:hypothetical protein
MNRLQDTEEPREPLPEAGDYFVLDAQGSCWYISTEMARTVDAELAACPAPGWITFVDLVGARVRLRTGRIESLAQFTAEQRAERRAFQRALHQERAAERTWDEEY